ncbi:ABC transporter permease [Brevibacillus thermoruber]|uniref:ABC transporter permease n=1 Tax=Brevibacillus thermoruber TaxID=33942 RepID=A0A9X3TQ04_9BACL|nr:ABC transporter permease [Brevibacillus thermoruber]MDA5107903.1 ABC transporter permease [Brevibacillus thermoruber]
MLQDLQAYFATNASVFFTNAVQHVVLSLTSIVLAMLICMPLGVFISRKARIADAVINAVNVCRVVPSLAVLALAMPLLGVGFLPALLALTVLACPPILINTYTAFKEMDPLIREAAKGMGMSPMQTIVQVEFPLALPVIVAGVRTASVEIIASASLAVLIGGGGLGNYIMNGIAMFNVMFLMLGAVPIALLAIVSEVGFSLLLKRVTMYTS